MAIVLIGQSAPVSPGTNEAEQVLAAMDGLIAEAE